MGQKNYNWLLSVQR